MRGFESIDEAQRDHSPDRLNSNCIKAALAYFHLFEKPDGLLVALEKTLALGPVITKPEYETLCQVLHVEPRDVPIARSRWY